MWTPRRILLLVLGAGLTLAAFLVYDRFLGWIDGLPALPERFLAVAQSDQPFVEIRNEDRIQRQLRQAFGDNCPELSYRYQLGLQSQGLILAMEHLEIEDGRVKLWPFSLAVLGKLNARTGFPEINTVHCDVARITFNRRIETLADISSSKMIAADFSCDRSLPMQDPRRGFIYITHNHATPQGSDDVVAQAPGPIHFEDSASRQPDKPQLWTTRGIEIKDHQSQPPHVVRAETLAVFLEPDALKGEQRRPQPGERSSAVRTIELGNVHMTLTIDKSSDFLSSPARTGPVPTEKPVLSIRTLGAFRFDVPSNLATFSVPKGPTALRQSVEVVRRQRDGNDELHCAQLQVQFRKQTATKAATPKSATPTTGEALAIDEVRAVGQNVTIVSALEKLSANGRELVFRQETREVILRGHPMTAVKDGNRIEAPELYLHRPDPAKPIDSSVPLVLGRAKGPGTVFLHEAKDSRRVEARWKGEMVMDREHRFDRITLDGGASFDDRENAQHLGGDQIRLWMLPANPSPAGSPGTASARPRKMQVTGHVEAQTPELIIDNTPSLVVWFEETERLLRPTGTAAPAPVVPVSTASRIQPKLGPPQITGPSSPNPPAKRPVRLSADHIETMLRRCGNAVELDRVHCRQRVSVRQDSERPGERGLKVAAASLDLTHYLEGEVLALSGSRTELASVEVQEMTLKGPRITCDQRDNRVDVEGAGSVLLMSSSNLNGDKLSKPTAVTISWDDRMDFVGNRVSFRGGVHAEQDSTRMRELQVENEQNRLYCPKMDVYLDRAVSFSAWHRAQTASARGGAEDRPRIRRVVCHPGGPGATGRVTVSSTVWSGSKLARFQMLEAPEATLENDAGEVTAAGPGEMRLFQVSDKFGAESGPEKPGAEQEFALTRVEFKQRMRANNRTQAMNFGGPVRIAHAPTDDPNLRVNPDRLPPHAFTLTCQALEVASHTVNGRRYATMVAEGKADIYANEFSGRADIIKYDESKKQQVIFDARDGGNPAVLYHFQRKGEAPKKLSGKTILYFRQTNEFRVSGADWIEASQ